MSRKIIYICVMAAFATLTCVPDLRAQEAAMMDVEMIDTESDKLRERTIYSPGESTVKYSPGSGSTPKDSLVHANQTSTKNTQAAASPNIQVVKPKNEKAAIPKAAAVQQKQTKSDDESILSFNFLYYIIEKYKLQDIVD